MAGFISPDKREQIRHANDIVDVIGAVVPLKRAGANFVGLCPFHREKTPSFNVNPQRQIFRCFGCGKGGDIISFVQDFEGLDFVDAVKRLADRAGIPLELSSGDGGTTRALKDSLLAIHDQLCTRWQSALVNEAHGAQAREYLSRRAVSAEAIKLFRLGFAPEAWDDTVNWAKSKGFAPALMEQAGLIVRKEGTDHHYDRFRGRLMFPISDELGRVIGFSGRVLPGDEQTAKYVNSPETPIFSKGKVFFGLDKSKRAILDAGHAVICEGQLDLIACFMGGVENVVAPQGTAFTENHGRILKRYVNEVILCFDADNAGQEAAVRALDALLASGLAIRVAHIPAGKDPDDYIRENGGEAFRLLLQRADGFFDFYLNRLAKIQNITTDRGRLEVLRAMSEAVHKTGSPVLIDTYAQKTAHRLGVAPDAVRAEFKKSARRGRPSAGESRADSFPDPAAAEEAAPAGEREFWLLRFLLLGEETLPWVKQHLDLQWVAHAGVRAVMAARLEAFEQRTWHGVPGLLDQFTDEPTRALITSAAAADVATDDLSRQIQESVILLRNAWIDQALGELTRRLGQGNLSEADLIEIERRKSELRQAKKQPLA